MLEEETGFIAITRLRQGRLVLHGIASPVLTVLLAADWQMVNKKLRAGAACSFLCVAAASLFAKISGGAWTNALRRQLRIIKSRYGLYAIFYKKFIRTQFCTGGLT